MKVNENDVSNENKEFDYEGEDVGDENEHVDVVFVNNNNNIKKKKNIFRFENFVDIVDILYKNFIFCNKINCSFSYNCYNSGVQIPTKKSK
jgi:hypothetical protein